MTQQGWTFAIYVYVCVGGVQYFSIMAPSNLTSFLALEIQPRALCMLSKQSTTELQSQPFTEL